MSRIKDYLIDIEEGRLVPGDLGDKCVCSEHFLDKELQGVIKQEGHRGKCSYCGERRTVINMPDFVRLVREKLESEFEDVDNAMLPLERTVFDDDEDDVPYFTRFQGYAAPSDSEMYDDTGEVITELLEITAPEALFNDVVSALPEHGWISQDPFVATLDDELNIKWKHFAEMVKHKQRFTFLANKEFEGLPSKYDNGLFDILTELGSLIHRFNICKDLDKDTLIYRARPIDKDTPLVFEEITCPPDEFAKQNRMSPAGVSMFYGSFDEETARKECTPHSGHDGKGWFLIGQFKQKRPLKLIDLTALPRTSFWNQKRQTREALAFMHIFHNEITKKIKSDDRIHTEYVPSQVFTEYLRYMFKLEGEIGVDGLIYKSSVSDNKCIVLFCSQKESEEYLELVNVEERICG